MGRRSQAMNLVRRTACLTITVALWESAGPASDGKAVFLERFVVFFREINVILLSKRAFFYVFFRIGGIIK